KEDVLNVARPLPAVQQPDPLPGGHRPLPPSPPTIADTTPGWGLTTEVLVALARPISGPYGLTLRSGPRRDAIPVGLVERGAPLLVTGAAQGEYTPLRVPSDLVRPLDEQAANPDPAILGRARLGLHTSTDPTISEAEHQEFAAARPGLIKVLSFHSAADVARLAAAHPDAAWIVRAFLEFGGRSITPDQFLQDTVADVKRCLDQLRGKQVVVELHNQPNVAAEGLGTVWSDGATFAAWWLELLAKYRHVLPGVRFIYPGLSPGSSVTGVKQDHVRFLETSRTAVLAADGLGLHLYWSAVYPLRQALQVLDDVIGRFRNHPLWITEAAHNSEAAPAEKARQYLHFWQELQKRPLVQGVAYFVASSSHPAVANQVWLGRGIAAMVGRR
ncbi:MAG: glycosyl hydrolase, partial [Chloroflexota bacterium]